MEGIALPPRPGHDPQLGIWGPILLLLFFFSWDLFREPYFRGSIFLEEFNVMRSREEISSIFPGIFLTGDQALLLLFGKVGQAYSHLRVVICNRSQ